MRLVVFVERTLIVLNKYQSIINLIIENQSSDDYAIEKIILDNWKTVEDALLKRDWTWLKYINRRLIT